MRTTFKNFSFWAALGALTVLAFPAIRSQAAEPMEHAVVKAWLSVWNTGTGDFDSFLAENVRYQGPFYSFSGRQHYQDVVGVAHRSYSGLKMTADDWILDGDRGALSWTVSATANISGNEVEMRGISMLEFADGKLVAEWRVFDAAELARQMGGRVTFPGDGDGDGSRTLD